MSQIGKAHYCDKCGVEIVSGDVCDECNPDDGSEQVSFWFVGTIQRQDEEENEPQKRRLLPWRR